MDSVRVSAADRKPLKVARLQSLQWITIGLLFLLFYGPLIPGLVQDWQEDSTYSHGFLIPFIAVYLVWLARARIRSITICPTINGIFPLLIAVVIGLAGILIGDSFSARVSMVLALGSSIYLLLGKNLFKELLFPIFYLALMIPVPYVLTKEVAYHLRFFDASLAESALQLLSIPVYRETYFLHLPNIILEVADMCAGIASIFALFALGNFYVYFLPVAPRIKLLLVLSTLPIAVFANLVRIIIVAVMAYYIGPVTLEMLFHRFSGTTTFLLALALLVGFGELLRKKWPQQHSAEQVNPQADRIDPRPGIAMDWRPFVFGAAIFAFALSISALLNSGRVLAMAGSGFSAIPSSLGSFAVTELNWQDPYEDPKADKSISRIYVGPDKAPVEVFLGYKGRQDGQDRLRSPKLILGEHWNFAWVKPALLDIGNSQQIEANWMVARKGNTTRLVLYWYQFGEITAAGELDSRINLVKRLLFDRRSDGAVIRLATPVASDEAIEKAQERLTALARQLYPELVKLLPQ